MDNRVIAAFVVPGEPVAKGRARAFIRGGKIGHHTPEKTARYENLVKLAASNAMAGKPPITGPVRLIVRVYLSIGASWSKKRQAAALAGTEWPTKRPDIDNIVKAIKDGMNGVVWVDDSQVVELIASKSWSDAPTAIIRVEGMQ